MQNGSSWPWLHHRTPALGQLWAEGCELQRAPGSSAHDGVQELPLQSGLPEPEQRISPGTRARVWAPEIAGPILRGLAAQEALRRLETPLIVHSRQRTGLGLWQAPSLAETSSPSVGETGPPVRMSTCRELTSVGATLSAAGNCWAASTEAPEAYEGSQGDGAGRTVTGCWHNSHRGQQEGPGVGQPG